MQRVEQGLLKILDGESRGACAGDELGDELGDLALALGGVGLIWLPATKVPVPCWVSRMPRSSISR